MWKHLTDISDLPSIRCCNSGALQYADGESVVFASFFFVSPRHQQLNREATGEAAIHPDGGKLLLRFPRR